MALCSGPQLHDQTFADQYPAVYYNPAAMFGNRWGSTPTPSPTEGSSRRRARSASYDVGQPEHRRTTKVVQPRLAARGFRVLAEAEVQPLGAVSDLGPITTQMGSIVLQFSSRGIDRALIIDSSPTNPLVFMTSAESRGYRPRYGLNSGHNVPFLEQNVPAAQLRGALGVGWTGPGTVVRTPPNARGKLCDDVLRKAGNPKPSSPVAAGIQSIYCGLFLFLQQVLAKPVDVTPPGFKAGAQQLGTSYWHPGAFAVRLTPARYQTGAAAVRPFAFDDACECFHWTGPQRPYP